MTKAMNQPLSPTPVPAARTRPMLWLLALAAGVVVVAQVSMRKLEEAGAIESAPAAVARFRLEQREGKFFRPGAAGPFTGWVTDHFAGGQLKLRSAVVDGWLHGVSEGWFTNGVPELREHFQRGVPHGARTTWLASGQKRSEGRLVVGQQQGVYRQWHENGKLAVEADFAAGKPHGLSRAWHPDGSLKAEALMHHGEVQARHVYPDGTRWEPALLAGTRIP